MENRAIKNPHPSLEQLLDFFLKALSPYEEQRVDTHLERCPKCRQELREIEIMFGKHDESIIQEFADWDLGITKGINKVLEEEISKISTRSSYPDPGIRELKKTIDNQTETISNQKQELEDLKAEIQELKILFKSHIDSQNEEESSRMLPNDQLTFAEEEFRICHPQIRSTFCFASFNVQNNLSQPNINTMKPNTLSTPTSAFVLQYLAIARTIGFPENFSHFEPPEEDRITHSYFF